MRTDLLPATPEGVDIAAAHLRAGGIVGMPTETVYGLAARVNDPSALLSVFEAKERPLFDPLIVHLHRAEQAADVVDREALGEAGRRAADALAALWPGPLTLVLPKRSSVPDLATSGLSTVAVRVPAHPVARALIAKAGPLAAPSANRFGRISPTTAQDVIAELDGRVRYVVDGGPCAVGVESTVVRVRTDGAVEILRPGGTPAEAIAAIAPVVPASAGLASPGQLPSHYAPRTPLTLVEGPLAELPPGRVAILVARGDADAVARRLGQVVLARSLSAGGDAAEASRNLFAALRALDGSGADRIVAEQWPEDAGLGHAIRDRLQRAAARSPADG